MATSVTIDEASEERLERLRTAIERETGEEVTHQELLDRIIEREFAAKAALVDSFRDDFDLLSAAEFEQWQSGTAASENPVDEEEIDRILYEEEAAPE